MKDEMIGRRFGRLIIEGVDVSKEKKHYWCKCDCGNRKSIYKYSIVKPNGTSSCGCIRSEVVTARWEKRRQQINPAISSIFSDYREGARRRGLEFELSREEFLSLIEGRCNYCGRSPEEKSNKNHGRVYRIKMNGIDRKDSQTGYTLQNSVSCCWRCNRYKGVDSIGQMLSHAREIAIYQGWIKD